MFGRQPVEALYQAALAALEEMDLDLAQRLGDQLYQRGHSSAYAVLARVQRGRGDLQKAIATLEEGTAEHPELHALWHQLATCYSDAARFADAHRAYAEARRHNPEVDPWVDLNEALTYRRAGKLEESLRLVVGVSDKGARVPPEVVAGLHAGLLNDLQRYDAALDVTRVALTQMRAVEAGKLDGHAFEDVSAEAPLAQLHAEQARALWHGRQQRAAALADVARALELDRTCPTACALLRAIDGAPSRSGRRMRLMLRGKWHASLDGARSNPPGFYTEGEVVADTPEEGLRYLARFEPEAVRGTLVVEEAEELDARPGSLKGVYWIAEGHTYFQE